MIILQVHPLQLVPDCVITEDIYGKTNHPIVKKDTIVSETHIQVLQSFLIEEVEVASRLANGLPFQPQVLDQIDQISNFSTTKEHKLTFLEHYHQVVDHYQKLFVSWQSGTPIEIQDVRQLIVPLLERVDFAKSQILLLANQASKDNYFYHHSVAISLLTALLSKRLGWEKEWIQISIAAFLADSGMAKMNRSLFEKKGTVSEGEFTEIKKHPTYSYRFVEKCPSLGKPAKLAILQHHEKLDGTGYPLGVTSDKIHSYAKIIAIADAYHAMTSERFYQNNRPFFEVISDMYQLSDIQFDATILQTFISVIENVMNGAKVRLSNGEVAEISSIKLGKQKELMVFTDKTNEFIVLDTHNNVTIESIIL